MNHIIILMLLNTKIKKSMMTAEVLQNSLLLLILYLFYTAEVWAYSSDLSTQEIQHASLITAKKYNQEIQHLSTYSQNLTWF